MLSQGTTAGFSVAHVHGNLTCTKASSAPPSATINFVDRVAFKQFPILQEIEQPVAHRIRLSRVKPQDEQMHGRHVMFRCCTSCTFWATGTVFVWAAEKQPCNDNSFKANTISIQREMMRNARGMDFLTKTRLNGFQGFTPNENHSCVAGAKTNPKIQCESK